MSIPVTRTLRLTCDKFSLSFLPTLRLPLPRPPGGGGGWGVHNHIYKLQYREYASCRTKRFLYCMYLMTGLI